MGSAKPPEPPEGLQERGTGAATAVNRGRYQRQYRRR